MQEGKVFGLGPQIRPQADGGNGQMGDINLVFGHTGAAEIAWVESSALEVRTPWGPVRNTWKSLAVSHGLRSDGAMAPATRSRPPKQLQ